MAYDFIATSGLGLRPLFLYAILELAILFRHFGVSPMVRFLRKFASSADMSNYGGIMLKARIGIVDTTIGGCAVDIDSDKDFVTAKSRFHDWIARIESEDPESV
jgi:hypothetical protein